MARLTSAPAGPYLGGGEMRGGEPRPRPAPRDQAQAHHRDRSSDCDPGPGGAVVAGALCGADRLLLIYCESTISVYTFPLGYSVASQGVGHSEAIGLSGFLDRCGRQSEFHGAAESNFTKPSVTFSKAGARREVGGEIRGLGEKVSVSSSSYQCQVGNAMVSSYEPSSALRQAMEELNADPKADRRISGHLGLRVRGESKSADTTAP
ncbi:hypothetical protein Q5P01_000693 [Channa striata]|uniref:Uncharacterized protein n=1 Tax=Channa striata TaxID=64152 RepID=A0AA88II61_CHASR|nr:hypothetical protein Q5P01_000693 [Channa striata]